ncbi:MULTISPECIES: glycosyltransferase family 4 protein [Corynebacterium]|uniref:Glycosyltransferase n=1 Tax=Corynebacterium singulare TaxID=161899 RepID=A0A0B6F226_9CORY|nr:MULTISPECIES: glycosyltransferase family 1 protein [Corynebacterium]AJI78505.1 glycosyltransferase [Corynebacterium singulare]OFT62354.1 glycosyl transferase [Corynebacterium sp. HMSC05E07]
MRIAIVTEVFLPKIDGVVTRLTRTLDQLAAMGHEVRIFATGKAPDTYAGFEVTRIPSLSLWVYPEIKFGLPSWNFFREIRDFDPDVIHAVNPIWTAALGVFAAQRDAVPLVASFHTNVPEYVDALGIGWTRPLTEAALKYLHNQAAVNLCTSGPMVDTAREVGIRNVKLWPKAVDTETYHPSRATAEMRTRLTDGNPEAPLLTYIGRVSKEKDLKRLNNVMRLVRAECDDARLAIVGDGPFLNELKETFDPSFTVFTGYLSGEELAAAFATGDVFLFPSATETLGLVALESFASRVPVIGTRAGGIPFVIEEGVTGHLIDPDAGDAAWANAAVELLQDSARRENMGAAARCEAEKYSWVESTQALLAAYEEAIEHPYRRD